MKTYTRFRTWNNKNNHIDGYWIPTQGNEAALLKLHNHLHLLKQYDPEDTAPYLAAESLPENEVDEYWIDFIGETKLEGTLLVPGWTSPGQVEDGLAGDGITKLMHPKEQFTTPETEAFKKSLNSLNEHANLAKAAFAEFQDHIVAVNIEMERVLALSAWLQLNSPLTTQPHNAEPETPATPE